MFAALDGTGQQHIVAVYADEPAGFQRLDPQGNTFHGRIKAGERVEFPYLTDPYDRDWTVELRVSAEIVNRDRYPGDESANSEP